MCSTIGVGERLHKVLGQIDLGTLDSGERSLPFGLLVTLTHISLASHFWDIGKQCRTRSYAAEQEYIFKIE